MYDTTTTAENERSRSRWRSLGVHLLAVLWIYLRFIVLAIIIFYLVEWYIREYDHDEEGNEPSTPGVTGKDEL